MRVRMLCNGFCLGVIGYRDGDWALRNKNCYVVTS